jgi:hypothetical protein
VRGPSRAGLPDVLADRRPDVHVAELKKQELAALGEVAVLVEDAVVRKELLAIDRPDLALGADGARVCEVAVEPRRSDERHDVARGARNLQKRLTGGVDEPRPKEEVLRRVAGDRELREDDEIGLRPPCVGEEGEDPLAVAVEISDHGVELGERKSQGFRL